MVSSYPLPEGFSEFDVFSLGSCLLVEGECFQFVLEVSRMLRSYEGCALTPDRTWSHPGTDRICWRRKDLQLSISTLYYIVCKQTKKEKERVYTSSWIVRTGDLFILPSFMIFISVPPKGLLGFLLNAVTVVAFFKVRQLRTPSNFLVFSLALADMGICMNATIAAFSSFLRWVMSVLHYERGGCPLS